MLPELGQYCLMLALALSLSSIISFCTPLCKINIIRPQSLGQVLFVLSAYVILTYCFLTNDFSVQYVAQNSNSNLAWYFKVTAVWGAHEGSLLLWILILNIWTLVLVLRSNNWSLQFINAVLAVFSLINAGFLCLLIYNSNPFLRIIANVPIDGLDLNPLLQDIGMIIHPPILYFGYVGCTVGFAFAVAALWQNKLDQEWASRLRPWVLAAWMFLTLGIALGSWWAYYELGWGGWWFWDPVENASFMPWLTTTALVHALIVASKRGQLLLMSAFLAILTFALSLFGTFLVRSGSIISVHAFASDPKRGLYILQFLTLVVGAAFILFLLRAKQCNSAKMALNSKTGFIFINNVLLIIATATVLLGTMYPLIYDALYHSTLSVGYPYFNKVFVPIMMLLLVIILPAVITNRKFLLFAVLCSLIVAVVFLYLFFGALQVSALIGVWLALAIIFSCYKSHKIPMILGHIGIAITIIGISITPNYEIERDVRMQIGDIISLAHYQVKFAAINNVEGANYISTQASFIVSKSNKILTTLQPERRLYLARETLMSETAIMPGLLQDIYIALGQQINSDTWAVRIYYKPFVRFIWLGALFMASAALFGILRRKKVVKRT